MKLAFTHLLAAGTGALLALLFLLEQSDTPEETNPRSEARDTRHSRHPLTARDATAMLDGKGEKTLNREEPNSDEYLSQLMGNAPSRKQLEDWLASQGRDADSLLAAGIILSDISLLTEALEEDPDNPHILFTLASNPAADPDQRLQWSRRLLEIKPHNAMASYTLASQLFKAGDHEAALLHIYRNAETT